MGWSGALGGLGKGMSNYAESMKEQQRLNWKSQQDAVVHERALNLEKLRASNQRTLANDKQAWASKEAELGRTQQSKEGSLNRGQQASQHAATIAAGQENVRVSNENALKRIPVAAEAKAKATTAEMDARASSKLKDVEAAYNLTKELNANDRKNRLEEFLSSPQANEMPEERRDFLAFAIEFPQEAQALALMDKTSKVSTEQYRIAYMAGREEWDALDKNAKKAFQSKIPGVEDPNDMKDLYARMIASNATGINQAQEMKQKGTQSILSSAAMQKARANPTLITEEDVMSTSDPNQQAELKSLMQGQVEKPGALQALSVPAEESPYVPGKPGRMIPDVAHKVFNKRPIDNTKVGARQRQLPWN